MVLFLSYRKPARRFFFSSIPRVPFFHVWSPINSVLPILSNLKRADESSLWLEESRIPPIGSFLKEAQYSLNDVSFFFDFFYSSPGPLLIQKILAQPKGYPNSYRLYPFPVPITPPFLRPFFSSLPVHWYPAPLTTNPPSSAPLFTSACC